MDWRLDAQERLRRMQGGMPTSNTPMPNPINGPYINQSPYPRAPLELPAGPMGNAMGAMAPGQNYMGAMGGQNMMGAMAQPEAINQAVAGLQDGMPNKGAGMGAQAAPMLTSAGSMLQGQQQQGQDALAQQIQQMQLANQSALDRIRMASKYR